MVVASNIVDDLCVYVYVHVHVWMTCMYDTYSQYIHTYIIMVLIVIVFIYFDVTNFEI